MEEGGGVSHRRVCACPGPGHSARPQGGSGPRASAGTAGRAQTRPHGAAAGAQGGKQTRKEGAPAGVECAPRVRGRVCLLLRGIPQSRVSGWTPASYVMTEQRGIHRVAAPSFAQHPPGASSSEAGISR